MAFSKFLGSRGFRVLPGRRKKGPEKWLQLKFLSSWQVIKYDLI
jgi:hypothetical protein